MPSTTHVGWGSIDHPSGSFGYIRSRSKKPSASSPASSLQAPLHDLSWEAGFSLTLRQHPEQGHHLGLHSGQPVRHKAGVLRIRGRGGQIQQQGPRGVPFFDLSDGQGGQTHSPTHPLTHPLTHSPTHPPTHPLTHSPTHSLRFHSLRFHSLRFHGVAFGHFLVRLPHATHARQRGLEEV